MTWEPRPLPAVTPETERFWAAAKDGVFLLQSCQDCGLTFHYPRTLCPDCFSEDVRWTPADGTGTLYSYSRTHAVEWWPEEHLPVTVAYVELDEGPRVVTALMDADDADLSVGSSVVVQFVRTDRENVSIPVFRLV